MMDLIFEAITTIAVIGFGGVMVWMTIDDMIDEYKSRKERRF